MDSVISPVYIPYEERDNTLPRFDTYPGPGWMGPGKKKGGSQPDPTRLLRASHHSLWSSLRQPLSRTRPYRGNTCRESPLTLCCGAPLIHPEPCSVFLRLPKGHFRQVGSGAVESPARSVVLAASHAVFRQAADGSVGGSAQHAPRAGMEQSGTSPPRSRHVLIPPTYSSSFKSCRGLYVAAQLQGTVYRITYIFKTLTSACRGGGGAHAADEPLPP